MRSVCSELRESLRVEEHALHPVLRFRHRSTEGSAVTVPALNPLAERIRVRGVETEPDGMSSDRTAVRIARIVPVRSVRLSAADETAQVAGGEVRDEDFGLGLREARDGEGVEVVAHASIIVKQPPTSSTLTHKSFFLFWRFFL